VTTALGLLVAAAGGVVLQLSR